MSHKNNIPTVGQTVEKSRFTVLDRNGAGRNGAERTGAGLGWWQTQSWYESVAVLAILIVICVIGRLTLEQPNFKPSMAAVLLASFILPNWRWAVWVPLVSMGFTDLLLGTYEFPVMVAVYLCLLAPALWYPLVQKHVCPNWSCSFATMCRDVVSLNVGAVGAAILFFIVTSFVVWAATPWYPQTWDGLTYAYVNALPFLRWMIQGNVVFLNGLLAIWLPYRMALMARVNDVQPVLPQ